MLELETTLLRAVLRTSKSPGNMSAVVAGYGV